MLRRVLGAALGGAKPKSFMLPCVLNGEIGFAVPAPRQLRATLYAGARTPGRVGQPSPDASDSQGARRARSDRGGRPTCR